MATPQPSKHWFCHVCRKYLFATYAGDPLPERDELYCMAHRPGGDGRSKPRGPTVLESHGVTASTPAEAAAIIHANVTAPAMQRRGRRPKVAYDAVPPEDKKDAKPGKRRMGVTRITQFRALDGSMHDTWQAATKHNTDNALTAWLSAFFEEATSLDGFGTSEDCTRLAAALRKDWMIARKKDPAA